MNKTKAILCDFDGVLANRFTELSAKDFCSAYSVNVDDFKKVSAETSKGLDIGQRREVDYFAELIARLSLKITPAELQKFFSDADAQNIQQNKQIYKWLNTISGKDVIIGLATNVSRELAERLEGMGLYDIFQKRYFSYEIGVTKTEQRFWQYVIKNLFIKPNNIIFIDDNKSNIDTAAILGIKGVIYHNFDQILEQISLLIR